MDDFIALITMCIIMLTGSYFAGFIPLSVEFSESKIRSMTVFGSGLLVGTALSVIIPEGIHMVSKHVHVSDKEPPSLISSRSLTKSEIKKLNKVSASLETTNTESDELITSHSLIGTSLVFGFIFMLFIDQLSENRINRIVMDTENLNTVGTNVSRNKYTATLGLIVHAAADGIALGAAATTNQLQVELIVFLAIMLHKAPAAFGLVSFLLSESLDRHRIKRHLILFSISAPLCAILTYFCLSQPLQNLMSKTKGTGIAMLFSAGTFLYVATVHVFPEIMMAKKHSTSAASGGGNGVGDLEGNVSGGGGRKRHFSLRELLLITLGSFIPVIFSFGHHH